MGGYRVAAILDGRAISNAKPLRGLLALGAEKEIKRLEIGARSNRGDAGGLGALPLCQEKHSAGGEMDGPGLILRANPVGVGCRRLKAVDDDG